MERFSLIGVDGNAFSLMGYTAKAMRMSGFTKDEIDKMYEEATSGDYTYLIGVCSKYVDEANKRIEDISETE